MTDSVPEYNWNNVEEQNFNPRMWADGFSFFKNAFLIGFENVLRIAKCFFLVCLLHEHLDKPRSWYIYITYHFKHILTYSYSIFPKLSAVVYYYSYIIGNEEENYYSWMLPWFTKKPRRSLISWNLMKLCRPANISEANFNSCEFHIQLFCYPSAYQVKKYMYLCYQLHVKENKNGSVGRQNVLFLFFDWREKSQPLTHVRR